jgi:hypothetical protein
MAKEPYFLHDVCDLAIKSMKELNWRDSSDPKKHLLFQKIEKLANFYAKNSTLYIF